MAVTDKYEIVIGLEVHVQLSTKSKIFAPDATEFGASPNSQVSYITLGHPGTLPMLNAKVVDYAVKLGLACNCDISRVNAFDRKNYFYADLPKGFQTTQDKKPICIGGGIHIQLKEYEKFIQLNRIHIEEDAGKSIHDKEDNYSLIDLNRAGVPLLEVVTDPVLSSSEEAYQYLYELKRIVEFLEICDGNMEEGSMRCDANVSLRLIGETKLGAKVEVKNMNSLRNVKRAIEFEVVRQAKLLDAGKVIEEQTRSFDADNNTTFALRSKEQAHDYRYFPEPDLQPIVITEEYLESIKAQMPALPKELQALMVNELGLSDYDAGVLTDEKELANYYMNIVDLLKPLNDPKRYKIAANWIMGPIKSYLNENNLKADAMPLKSSTLVELIELVQASKVNNTSATQKLIPALIAQPNKGAEALAQEMNLMMVANDDWLGELVDQALAKYPDKVKAYQNGRKGVIGLFMGEIMKASKGKIDPKEANKLLAEKLNTT